MTVISGEILGELWVWVLRFEGLGSLDEGKDGVRGSLEWVEGSKSVRGWITRPDLVVGKAVFTGLLGDGELLCKWFCLVEEGEIGWLDERVGRVDRRKVETGVLSG